MPIPQKIIQKPDRTDIPEHKWYKVFRLANRILRRMIEREDAKKRAGNDIINDNTAMDNTINNR